MLTLNSLFETSSHGNLTKKATQHIIYKKIVHYNNYLGSSFSLIL